jgi:hypothetical protein
LVSLDLVLLIRGNLLCHFHEDHGRDGARDQAGQRHEEVGFHWSLLSFRFAPVGIFAIGIEHTRTTWRFNALITPIRAIIVDPPRLHRSEPRSPFAIPAGWIPSSAAW